MRYWILLVAGMSVFSLCARAEEAEPERHTRIKVLNDNVNLRARPTMVSETVGQVSKDDELKARSFTEEWVEIVPPSSVDLWVLGDYVRNEVIDGDNVNVRAGAGINFSIVGQLNRGAGVEVRGSLGPWVSIGPPDTCSIWVHASLVEEIVEIAPEPESLLAGIKDDKELSPEVEREYLALQLTDYTEPDASLAPSDLDLLPSSEQGRMRQYEGVLRPRSFLVRSPSRFRLVAYDERQRAAVICFVKGNDAQLEALLNRHMIVRGREYWVRRSEHPVLVPERIILKGSQ